MMNTGTVALEQRLLPHLLQQNSNPALYSLRLIHMTQNACRGQLMAVYLCLEGALIPSLWAPLSDNFALKPFTYVPAPTSPIAFDRTMNTI